MGGTSREAPRGVRLRSPAPPIDADSQSPLRTPASAFVHVVDDDITVRESLGDLLRSMNYQVTLYGSASDFLKVELPDAPACLVLDVRLPGTSGASCTSAQGLWVRCGVSVKGAGHRLQGC